MIVLKNKTTVKCLFCEGEENVEEEAKFHSNIDSLVKECSVCNINSMIALHENISDDEAWECILCGIFINRASSWNIGEGKGSENSIRLDL